MPRFFVKKEQESEKEINIIGEDIIHIKNVLRKQIGDILEICNEDTGNVGKAYRRNDEIGTPICITVDFETFEKEPESVTIRDRDTMEQVRVNISDLKDYVLKYFAE